ncbi:MAG TPA: TPM domain-containing protein [Chitinophagales bacterium]|nr:TPM domain-containing protein [Chitinophagales bacterium]
MKKKFLCLIVPMVLSLPHCVVQKQYSHPEFIQSLPLAKGHINDFENDFTSSEIFILDSVIAEFQKQTTNQIAIVTVSSIAPYDSVDQFTTDLGNYWGVGDKKKNNGLMIVFSKARREVWIGTGTGTEKILTDIVCKQIIDAYMLPRFKEGNYFEGVHSGLMECIKHWQ